MNKLIGVDIGGTSVDAGLVESGKLLKEASISIRSKGTQEEILADVIEAIDAVFSKEVKAIGVGVPAVVSPETGVVYDVQNLTSWKEVPLKDLLERHYNLPVYINNDANCFVKGAFTYGEVSKVKNVIGLCIGTGLGMGVIINKKLYNGVLCGAGEVGMLPYKDSIFENYTSSFFFKEKYGKSAKEMSQLANNGDQEAIASFLEFGVHLGEAIKSILYMFAPEVIILGGSISKAYSLYKTALETTLKTFAYPKQLEGVEIVVSNESKSAILGAAALCLD